MNPKLLTSLIFLGVYRFLIFSHRRKGLIVWIVILSFFSGLISIFVVQFSLVS